MAMDLTEVQPRSQTALGEVWALHVFIVRLWAGMRLLFDLVFSSEN